MNLVELESLVPSNLTWALRVKEVHTIQVSFPTCVSERMDMCPLLCLTIERFHTKATRKKIFGQKRDLFGILW